MGSHDVGEVEGGKAFGSITNWNLNGEVELDLIWDTFKWLE